MYNRYPMNQNIIAEALAVSGADFGPMSYRTPDGRTILCKGGGKGGKGIVGKVLGVVAAVVTGFAAAPLMANLFLGSTVMASAATGALAGAAGGLAGTGTLRGTITGGLLGGVGGGVMGAVTGGSAGALESAGQSVLEGSQFSAPYANAVDYSGATMAEFGGGAAGGFEGAATGAATGGFDSAAAGLNAETGMPNYATDSSYFAGGSGASAGLNAGAQTLEGSQFSAPYQNTPDYSAAAPAQSTTDYTAPGASSQTTTTSLDQSATPTGTGAAAPQQTANNAPSGGDTKVSAPGGGHGSNEDPWYKKMDWAGAGLKVGANVLGAQAQAPGAEATQSYLNDVKATEKTAQNYNVASADKKAAIGDKLAVDAGAMDPNYYASQQQNSAKNRGNAQWLEQEQRMRAQGMDPQAIAAERTRFNVGNSQNEGTAYDSGYQTGVGSKNATYGAAGSMYGQIGQPSAGLASAYLQNNAAKSKAQEAAGNAIEQATGVLTGTTKATPEKKAA